jgi:glycine/D-amino acid oxidase-like deaminating enzyme
MYHPSAYDTGRKVPSYWEATAGPAPGGCAPLSGDASCDVAIIGGGYTGLSAALHLAHDHGIDAAVLEAGPPGWGASGRNGGFCCIGGAKLSGAAMMARVGLDEVRRFYASQIEAIDLVDALGRDEGIDYDRQGHGTLEVAHKPARYATLKADADWYRVIAQLPCRIHSPEEWAEQGYRGSEAHGALLIEAGFALHPLKYHRGLTAAALRRGARVHTESRVDRWEREGGRHRLITRGGTLTARRVVIATNGYTPDTLHPYLAGTFLPAFSNIVTTRPLTSAELAAQNWQTETPIWDSRNLLFYFRLLKGGCLLFGARGGTSGTPASEARFRTWLERRLGEMWPAWAGIATTHFWSGLVCLSANLTPMVGRVPDEPSVFYGLAYHGNGVTTATWTGRALARSIAGADDSGGVGIPALMAAPPRRFPLPAWRRRWLQAAYLWYRLKDML